MKNMAFLLNKCWNINCYV